jgi:hypothetical protein
MALSIATASFTVEYGQVHGGFLEVANASIRDATKGSVAYALIAVPTVSSVGLILCLSFPYQIAY